MARVLIVFEDLGELHFNVYLDGDKQRLIDKSVDVDKLSPAEYHAAQAFSLVGEYLEESGVLKQSIDMGGTSGQN